MVASKALKRAYAAFFHFSFLNSIRCWLGLKKLAESGGNGEGSMVFYGLNLDKGFLVLAELKKV